MGENYNAAGHIRFVGALAGVGSGQFLFSSSTIRSQRTPLLIKDSRFNKGSPIVSANHRAKCQPTNLGVLFRLPLDTGMWIRYDQVSTCSRYQSVTVRLIRTNRLGTFLVYIYAPLHKVLIQSRLVCNAPLQVHMAGHLMFLGN